MRNLAILLAALAMTVAACGTNATTDQPTDNGASETGRSVSSTTTTTVAPTTTTSGPVVAVLASFETKRELTAARIEGTIEISGFDDETTGLTEATIRFGSSFNEATGDSSFLMDMSSFIDALGPEDDETGLAAGFLGETEFRTIGDRVYVKFPFVTALLGAETDWVSMPEEESSTFVSEGQDVPQDPNEILDAYEDANGTVEDLGEEEVNGVTATHYRVLLDADSMRLTAEERRELEESGLFAAGEIPMDLWISSDGFLVRLVFEVDGAGLTDVAPEEQFDRMLIRYDVFDINGDVRIEPPSADQVTAIEDLDPFGFGEEG